MNTLVRYCTLVLLVLVAACAKSPQDKLVGEWKGTDDMNNTASFVFDRDGNAKMLFGNKVLDGPTAKGKVVWTLNENQEPMHLDIAISDSSGKKNLTIAMIARFVTDNKIQICINEDLVTRPTSFLAPEKNLIVLTRQ